MKTDRRERRLFAMAWMAMMAFAGLLAVRAEIAVDSVFYQVAPQPRIIGSVRFRSWQESLALPETQAESVVAVRDAMTAGRLNRLTERFEMRRPEDASILRWAARAAEESDSRYRDRDDGERGAFDGWISDFVTRQDRYGEQVVWDEALSGRARAAPGRERSWGWLADDVRRHQREETDPGGFYGFGDDSAWGSDSGSMGESDSFRPGWHPGGAGRIHGPESGAGTLPFPGWR